MAVGKNGGSVYWYKEGRSVEGYLSSVPNTPSVDVYRDLKTTASHLRAYKQGISHQKA